MVSPTPPLITSGGMYCHRGLRHTPPQPSYQALTLLAWCCIFYEFRNAVLREDRRFKLVAYMVVPLSTPLPFSDGRGCGFRLYQISSHWCSLSLLRCPLHRENPVTCQPFISKSPHSVVSGEERRWQLIHELGPIVHAAMILARAHLPYRLQ